ncbi:sensor domain-containing diguanylate cyclase [uncultured Stenotrophomonas sp.]|uniref:GGDEF domain-containing protein n=1 Tax=uncultured Stenotrophomonas sp. TaxID=165438 RepID=UPI0025FCDFC1|nr:sensor domain-containing diguanylate cyclase [uncultured Stenotrophomonas sp.]
MRFVGALLAALPIASVGLERGMGRLAFVFLLVNALVWPVIAQLLTRRAARPAVVQFRCMVVDSLLGGAWIAFMAVSAVPSALFAALLVADKIAAGGTRLALKATAALLLGFLAAWLAMGTPWQPATSSRTFLLSLPFLFVYGIGLSALSWRLARRVRSQNRQLQRLSRMDPLVELANRGYLMHRAQQMIEAGRALGRTDCLLMLDVDDFKRINDTLGHRTGDEALRRIAAVLRSVSRPGDTPGRLGGDEFALLLAGQTPAEAMLLAEKIRSLLHVDTGSDAAMLDLSVSIGIAAAPTTTSAEEWLARADQALYESKRHGKNTASCGTDC